MNKNNIWDNYRSGHNPVMKEISLVNKIYSSFYWLRRELKFFKKNLKKNSKALFIASSTFWFVHRFAKIRPDLIIFCVDISKHNINNPPFNFVVGDALRLPFKDESFDFVVSCYLLEHLSFPNNIQLFTEIARVLKKNGFYYIETEGTSFLHFLDLPIFFGKDVELSFFDDPTHIRPYTRRSLIWLSRMTGLSPISSYRVIVWLKLFVSPILLLLGLVFRKTKYFSYLFSIFNNVAIIGKK
jgi:SAM-dependent methyltransferase